MKINIKSIRYGAFILTVGNICSQLLGFVYRIALSRLIGSEGMGLFQLIFPFYSLALTITVSGIGVAVSKLTAEYMALRNYEAIRMLVKRAIIVFVCIFSVLSLIVLLFAKGIANVFLGDERTLLAIYALLPVILLTGIENIHKHFFYGSREFNPPALSDLLEQIIRMSAVLLLLRLLLPQPDELMLVIIVTGMLICEIFSSVFLKTVYRHRMRKMPSTGKVESRLSARIGKIAVPISLAGLCNNLLSSLIFIIIPRRLVVSGMSYSQALSSYGVLFGMTLPLLNLPSAMIVGLGLVMVPKLSEDLALGNIKDVRSKISRAITTASFLILPAVAVLVPLGPQIGRLLYGQNVSEELLLRLAMSTVFSLYMFVLGNILNGLGKQTAASVNHIAGNALELILTYYLTAVPELGIYGFIIASIVTTLLTAALNLRKVIKSTGMKADWRNWFVTPGLSALASAFWCRWVYLRAVDLIGNTAALIPALLTAILVYLLAVSLQGGFRMNYIIGNRTARKFRDTKALADSK